jgi:hypothetical protein
MVTTAKVGLAHGAMLKKRATQHQNTSATKAHMSTLPALKQLSDHGEP